ncbi:serine/threonine protein kinase [Pseudanabaena sp. FACHB-1998]|uniref:serine/threonine-protein kinase n=1 Tax=Pseudanabaena sp. FACHB-1998 TaxID=2692858 RepID=UPI00168152AC|nr:serine/threonine-protein kinase [Pseudanabaena sp. FACHB-1998]MBD2179171.1 serine/threonine protein kinase [Pseudanabaena sp. FACHB-1998]
MRLCINPSCKVPNHPDNDDNSICQSCGSELLIDDCYSVTKLLNDSGGFGVVYEIENPAGQAKILKILKQELNEDSKAVSLFQQEAFVLGQIEHAGIPKIETYVHHTLVDGKILHGIVMQKILGLNLEEWINQRQNKPIAQKRAIVWLRQLVEILSLVHSRGYFHRDIKPANVMMTPSGQLVLIDFGTAREATHTYLAKIGGLQGVTSICSVGYTAPEQEKGFAVPQSDFYSLGCTMIHLVTGKYPLDYYNPARDMFEWRSHATEISDEFGDLIDVLIARKPSDRPVNCESILKVLKEIEKIDQLAPHHKNSKRKSIQKALKESTRKPPSPIVLTVAVIVAACAGLSIGTVIKISVIGEEINIQLPVFRQKRITPTRYFIGHSDNVQNLAISPNGKTLASASDDGTVKFWDLENDNPNPIREIRDQGGWVRAVVFISDREIATAGQDKNIKIINIASGKIERTLSKHTNLINNLAIAPASNLIASGSYDNTVNLWQISTGKLLRTLTGHKDKIWGVAIAPDGKVVVSASRDKELRIWDVKTGETIKELKGHQSGVTAVLITPDGKQIISASNDKSIRIWDLASGKQLFVLTGHDEVIGSLAITSNGKYLVSGSKERSDIKDNSASIRLWNLQNRSSIANLIGHVDLVNSLVISSDNLKLISSGQDKNINVWDLPKF